MIVRYHDTRYFIGEYIKFNRKITQRIYIYIYREREREREREIERDVEIEINIYREI